MERVHRISERTLSRWRGAFIWVDVWHLASVERFSVVLKATWKKKLAGCYWCRVSTIGSREFYSIQDVIDFCVSMLMALPSLRQIWGVKAFSMYGSSKYKTAWLREQIETSLKQDS